MTLAFMTREIAVRWLQTEAVKRAQRKYGPEVKTSIGRCTDTRILCNYLALDQHRVMGRLMTHEERQMSREDKELGG